MDRMDADKEADDATARSAEDVANKQHNSPATWLAEEACPFPARDVFSGKALSLSSASVPSQINPRR